MEKYFFGGTLLVPLPKPDSSYTFCWVGTLLNNPNNKIEVIAFNTDNKNNFQPMLKADLNTLMHLRRKGSRKVGHLKHAGQNTDKDIAQLRNIKNQIRFIKNTLKQMADSVYIKRAEQPILDSIGQQFQCRLAPRNVIYLSWITAVERV